MTAMLEMRNVSKSFAGVQALRDVNFSVHAGQIHALVGENGVKTVPSYLLKPVVVYKDNWEKVLVDSGYYKKSQFQ